MAGLLLFLLFSGFHQVGYIPRGRESAGRMLLGDTDRNGLLEIIFVSREDFYYKVLWFYEQEGATLFDFAVSDSMIIHNDTLDLYLWEVGDFDLDGLYDLAFYYGRWPGPTNGIAVYESPDSFSYPTQEVWRDTIGFPLVIPICVYDIDSDGIPEIVNGNGNEATDFNIFESTGDNSYELIYTGYPPFSCASTFAFGDFDSDNANEFVFGGLSGWYAVYECNGNNSYVEIFTQLLPTRNIIDCFSVPDADGDSKLEFVVKGYWWGSQINAYIFEATGDNTYEIIKTFDFPCAPYSGGYSAAGDVDGDEIPEIVLEACQNIYIIKSAGNDSFYVWETLPGNDGGSSIAIYDIDGNGLAEIVISGNDQTRIYEYQVGIAEAGGSVVLQTRFEIFPNPFRHAVQIRCSMQNAKFSIYDATGRLVKSLCHESGIVNRESIFLWHGDDEQGKAVAPGVYFVRLESPGEGIAKKIVKLQ
ncbi:T9SS type A sorting domain-containing protein [candidate division WOR-3 bacterium]|nr:T9SS type A sorting domain-containing protein [candidate division WOR-3 bacterium]